MKKLIIFFIMLPALCAVAARPVSAPPLEGQKEQLYEVSSTKNKKLVFTPPRLEKMTCLVQPQLSGGVTLAKLISTVPMTIYDQNGEELISNAHELNIAKDFKTTKITLVNVSVKEHAIKFDYVPLGKKEENGLLMQCFW